jgi:hypothetical protein
MQFLNSPADSVGKHGGIMSFSTTKTSRSASSGYTIDWIDRTTAPYNDHGFRLHRWDGGVYRNLGSIGTTFNLVQGQWYQWKVVMDGADITLYVDGNLIGSWHDGLGAPYTCGYVGFWLYSNGEHAHFDDLCVRGATLRPLSGWHMQLFKDGAQVGPDAVTDANGVYSFTVKYPGTYDVRELLQDGWTELSPVLTYSPGIGSPVSVLGYSGIVAKSGTNVPGKDFWNFRWATVRVEKIDTSGRGLVDWEITLGGLTQKTDSGGVTTFTVKKPGIYGISEVKQAGWTLISPASNLFLVDVDSGDALGPYVFVNFKDVTITVNKKDTDDKPLEGWTIYIEGPGAQVDSADTDGNGVATFVVNRPGDYSFTEYLESGWTQISPGSGVLEVKDVVSGVNRDAGYFVNFEWATVEVVKKDYSSKLGLDGWTINLVGPNAQTGTTGSNGVVTFTVKLPGDYSISEELQDGWQLITPASNNIAVTVKTGGQYGPCTFENFKRVTISSRMSMVMVPATGPSQGSVAG